MRGARTSVSGLRLTHPGGHPRSLEKSHPASDLFSSKLRNHGAGGGVNVELCLPLINRRLSLVPLARQGREAETLM